MLLLCSAAPTRVHLTSSGWGGCWGRNKEKIGNHVRVEWDKGAEVEIATAPVPPVSPSLLAMHFLASEAVFPELGKL